MKPDPDEKSTRGLVNRNVICLVFYWPGWSWLGPGLSRVWGLALAPGLGGSTPVGLW